MSSSLLKNRNGLLLNEYRDLLNRKLLLLAACNNLNSAELFQLRNKLSAAGVNVKMIKTSVFKKALNQDSPLLASLNGPVMAWSSNREVGEVGKLVTTVLGQQPRVHLLAARIESQEWTREGCKDALQRLPTRTEAQQQLLGLLQTPVTALLSALQQPPAILAALLNGSYTNME